MYRFSRLGTVLGVVCFLSLGVLAGRWYLQHELRSSVPATASRSDSPAQERPNAMPPLETPAPPPPGGTVQKQTEPTATAPPPQKAVGEKRVPDPTPRAAGDSAPPPASTTTPGTEDPAPSPRTAVTRSQPGTAHTHPGAPRPAEPPVPRPHTDTSAPSPGDTGMPEEPRVQRAQDDPASHEPMLSPEVLRTLFQKRLEALRYLE